MMDDIDNELIEQCQRGDTGAFGTLVEKYQRPLFNVIVRMVNDYEDARDIAQTVFVKAFEKLDSFDRNYRFFSWLYRIMINETINFLNQCKPRSELHHEILSGEKLPDEQYQENELSERVQNAVMALQVDYRIVILLRHFEDLSYMEMGQVLDIPEKTVKSRLFTARRQLSEILTKQGVMVNE